jgi:hypothetical protein
VFDNSGSRHKLLAEVTDRQELAIRTSRLPRWFVETSLWQAFSA